MADDKRVVHTTAFEAAPGYGSARTVENSSISWKAIFAGTFVAILTYLILMAFGLAIGGGNLRGALQGEGLSGFGIGAGIWLIFSVVVSLFVGAYASGRVAGLVSNRVGRTQGLVVASLFFVLLLMQASSAISTLGSGIGSVVGSVGGAIPNVAQNEQVQQTVRQALGDLNLQSPPEQVAQGIAVRLIQGDTDGAVSYLSNQANIPEAEARQRIQTFGDQITGTLNQAGRTAAQVIQAAGWTLFVTFLLGAVAGLLGGMVGARTNLKKPLGHQDERALHDRRAA